MDRTKSKLNKAKIEYCVVRLPIPLSNKLHARVYSEGVTKSHIVRKALEKELA